MEGTIKKIVLRNFVTYDAVECMPCENLNIIIGPNGTGKSTIVSAIMLGLGEKPNATGRGKKVQEFIKTGCQEARIILELHPHHKVERIITMDGKSLYRLNDKLASEKDINNFTKQLNIQVGNLCQFLPQDRVNEFSKMNKKELLEKTQEAVGGDELVKLHKQLIELQGQSQNQGRGLDRLESSLSTKREQNARLHVDITTITEKNNLLAEIVACKRKLAWLLYEDARKDVEEAKKAYMPKKEEVEKTQTAFQPIQEQKDILEGKYRQIKDNRKKTARSFDLLESKLKGKLEEVQETFSTVRNLEYNDRRNTARDEERTARIQALKQSIDEQNQMIAEMEVAFDGRKQQAAIINAELETLGKLMLDIDHQIAQIKSNCAESKYESQELRNKIARNENVQEEKLQLLRRVHRDAYIGAQWLKENRDKFRGTVYLPLMVELNVSDSRYAKYVEASIGRRDLIAFSCEHAEDVNLLTNELRRRQGLKVNIFQASVNKPVAGPHLSVEEIRRLGFDGYLEQYITVPEPIKTFLMASSSIHRIPVSYRDISADVRLPSNLNRYYAGNSCVSITHSRYSGEAISSDSVVRQAYCLAITQDVLNLEADKNRLREIEVSLNTSAAQISDLNKEKEKMNELCAQKRTERNKYQQANVDLKSAKMTRDRHQQDLTDLERERKEFVASRNELQKRIPALIKESVNKQTASAAIFEDFYELYREATTSTISEVIAKHKLANVMKTYKKHQKKVDDAQADLECARDNLQSVRIEAKKRLEEAKKETEGTIPNEPAFIAKYQPLFNTFPSTIVEIEKLINEKQALVACKRNVDDSILREYEDRKKEIDQLEKNIREIEQNVVNFKTKMASVRERWLTNEVWGLRVLVNKIATNFSKYCQEIQCAGDVVLDQGQNEHDYENYGLNIMVSYRHSAPLKELDDRVQSGGERAVATALYMMSLQELTKVPFRCVDEINQGMDETNERRVYKLLMAITSSESTSQYFLLTPKLLKGIDYSQRCMVHCVFNGPHVLPYKHWNIDAFIKRKERHDEMETD